MKTIAKFSTAILLVIVSGVLSAASFQLPAYQEVTLDNGLTLLLMEHDEVPLINVEVRVKAGAIDSDIKGLANVTAEALTFGNANRSKQEINDALDFTGSSFSTWSDKELSGVSASFLNKNTDLVLEILENTLKSPKFENQEVEKFLNRYATELQQKQESPRQMIGDYFNALYFAQHPYAISSDADKASLKKIDRTAIENFYQRYYQPNNTVIAVVGDFNSKDMANKITKRFSNWKNKHKQNTSDIKPYSPKAQAQVLLVDKDDARETTFMIGGKGIARGDENYVALQVLNTILGGRFTSWLNDELRVNSGLTYGARSRFATMKEDGTFAISTFTKTDSTEQAIDLALKTYQRLWKKGIDQATLDSAKAYVKGQFPPRYETAGQLADLLVSMKVMGIDASFINEFNQSVNALTLEKTKQLIEQYFPKQHLQFVLIGKADDIRDVAKKYGAVKEIEMGETVN